MGFSNTSTLGIPQVVNLATIFVVPETQTEARIAQLHFLYHDLERV